MLDNSPKGLRGFLIDAPEPGRLRSVRDGAVLIEDGAIAAVGTFEEIRHRPGADRVRWQHSSEAVIIPGLVDLHAHLPQYPAVARLEEGVPAWRQPVLQRAEKEFNSATARILAPQFFNALAQNGTTSVVLHAGVSVDSCDVAFEAAERCGLRVAMGKVMLDERGFKGLPTDRNGDTSLDQSERLCRKWNGRDRGRVEYVFTPSYANGCTEKLARGAAEKARELNARVQTHFLQDPAGLQTLRERCANHEGMVSWLGACGLLGESTILADCVRISSSDIQRLAESQTAVAHCPTAHSFVGLGIAPLDRLLKAGVRVGLGSDVGAGPELSLWRVMRSAIESEKARAACGVEVRVPKPADVFHLATVGGANALGKTAYLGTLDIGKDADLVVLDLPRIQPLGLRGNVHSDYSAEEVIAMMVHRGGTEAIIETFVRGRSVFRAPSPMLL